MTHPVEHRTAGAVLDVKFPERRITLIAIPYNEPARVEHRGRLITETVEPGAFAGIEARAPVDRKGNVKVNLAHDFERVVGRAVSFTPGDPRGLLSELHISNTSAGDDVLALAEDELLDASIGFYPLPGGERYNADRSQRTITRAYLDHIALTGAPAYEGAKVLSVRAALDDTGSVTATPRLDAILLERRLDEAMTRHRLGV